MALPYATENQLKLLEQKTKSELDKKTENVNLTADTLEDMNALVTQGSVNDGQLCYCKEDKQIYVFKNNTFRKMIDYKVEEGKITSIDGYNVGGDELTGDDLMGITKDSTTITRTLDTDGKVKFDNSKIPQVDTRYITGFEIGHNQEYTAGEYIISDGVDLGKAYNNLRI